MKALRKMHVNTALGTLAHKGMNISTHIINSGLQSIYVKEKGLCCLGNLEIQSLLVVSLCKFYSLVILSLIKKHFIIH